MHGLNYTGNFDWIRFNVYEAIKDISLLLNRYTICRCYAYKRETLSFLFAGFAVKEGGKREKRKSISVLRHIYLRYAWIRSIRYANSCWLAKISFGRVSPIDWQKNPCSMDDNYLLFYSSDNFYNICFSVLGIIVCNIALCLGKNKE